MLKDLFKAILLLSAVVVGGNLITLCQKVTSTIPGYIMLLTIICMLIVMWYNVVKLMISINKGE